MRAKRLIGILLAALLASSSFVSCSDNNADESKTESGSQAASDAVSGSDSEIEETKFLYSEQVEANDYDGWVLRIPNSDKGEAGYSFDAEEVNGEVLNDAIYNRNRRVENKFNITIEEVEIENEVSLLSQSVAGGLRDYAIYHVLMWDCVNIIAKNLIRPISSMPYIDISNPYWDPGVEDIMFNDVLYYGYSDITFNHYESMATLFYNGQLLENNQLELPYDLFIEGKWTVDKMYEYVETVSSDANGDGQMNIDDDIIGFAGRDFSQLGWLHASGMQLISYDSASDEYKFDMNTERMHQLYESVYPLTVNGDYVDLRQNGDREAFMAGRVLFLAHQINVFRQLRSADDPYGIICYPSVDGDVDTTKVHVNNAGLFVIPILCVDEEAERLGNILEAWAADSYDYLMEDYFRYAVVGKGANDEKSADMIYRMRDMREFDIAYAIEGSNSSAIGAYERGITSGNIASFQEKFEDKVNKIVNGIIEDMSVDNTY